MTTPFNDIDIEAAAKAVYEASCINSPPTYSFESLGEDQKSYRKVATAAFTAAIASAKARGAAREAFCWKGISYGDSWVADTAIISSPMNFPVLIIRMEE